MTKKEKLFKLSECMEECEASFHISTTEDGCALFEICTDSIDTISEDIIYGQWNHNDIKQLAEGVGDE